jgi:hypothetical protein
MKAKSILIVWFIFLLAGVLPAKDKGYVILHGTFFIPASTEFKNIYGSSAIVPGIGFGIKVMRNIFFFAGADFLFKTGSTVGELKDPAKTKQIFASGGLEMRLALTPKLDAAFRAGAAYISYWDKVFSETTKGNGFGFLFGAGVNWKMKSFFLAFDIDYLRATDTPFVDKIVLGGMKTAIGIGRFF